MTEHTISEKEISSTWVTYGVEYSAATNDIYIQYYIRHANGQITYGNKVNDFDASSHSNKNSSQRQLQAIGTPIGIHHLPAVTVNHAPSLHPSTIR